MIELFAAEVTAWVPPPGGGPERVVRLLGPVSARLAERRVAVVGANGSGKSTLARLVGTLVRPSAGAVRVDGLDTVRDAAAVRRRVGFVFTDPDAQLLMPTPAEDVALSLRGLPARDRRAAALAWLDRFGLAGLADTPAHVLSGGQKQLLALASVLATGPAVLVCDEPTTLLDLRWRTVVDDALAGLDQQVLLVTHDLDAAARADRVLVVDHGAVVEDGAPAPALDAYRALMAVRASRTGRAGDEFLFGGGNYAATMSRPSCPLEKEPSSLRCDSRAAGGRGDEEGACDRPDDEVGGRSDDEQVRAP
jgi:biotin transport system ATP-binding protein